MGGGGSGFSEHDLSRLEELARQTLRESSSPQKRNVFISFVSEDLNDVNMLRGQAKNESSSLEFNDWSLREPFESRKAEYIRRGIRERIQHSSLTLVYLSDKTSGSKWVSWEIEESLSLGKGVLGVYKGESPPSPLPSAFSEHHLPTVKWTHTGLAAAIEGAASST